MVVLNTNFYILTGSQMMMGDYSLILLINLVIFQWITKGRLENPNSE